MNGFFDTILNIVLTSKENRKYKELTEDPQAAAISARFGKKFIINTIQALIINAVAIAFGAIALNLHARETDLLTGLLFFVYILCIAGALLLALYAVILILSRLKFVKWQCRLNDLPIGKKAHIFALISVPCVIILSAIAVLLVILSFV